ncbi:hypothetical protein [Desulfosporosinus meridiei]|uniref:Histidine-specific methyltransferase SAM-dependent domain-containing protein n=1 Tax=Desulfosporosinus meridiei (strain ATCC BAA-275 / DSM 13257 / KCTC 12902 / NCIMB 13706 / S10) TaxID=768704 RepID=J7IWQ2_DESMD|nr:hypothetical protein [Desulfosporosinus meridiei]AFQ43543.1 hypothetical protein Desmer_1552 [Desulfosporosinus meridiei DSM 13257]
MDLNFFDELKKSQIIPGAYKEWSSFRYQVTEYIISNTTDFESIAIFGAGKCNDIDLNILESKFNKVILIDIDMSSMKEGIYQYSLENSKKIELIACDFLGIEDSDYREYEYLVRKYFFTSTNNLNSRRKILSLLDNLTDKIDKYPLVFGKDAYKNSVLIGVHSQLNVYLQQIWSICLQITGKTDNLALDKMKKMNEIIAKKLNAAVIESTEDKVFIGYEMGIEGQYGGIEGAIQAENDLELRLESGLINISSEFKLVWPFKPDCKYDMRVTCICKNKA